MLTISEVAELSGITRSNLLYYDEIDILKPAYRGENNYRLYSYQQLDLLYIIISLRDIGLPLKAIKDYAQNRTPERAQSLFENQISVVDRKIDKLQQLREFLKQYTENIRLHKNIETPLVGLELRKAETIVLGPAADKAEDALTPIIDFIRQCRANGNFINHMGQIFLKQRVSTNDWTVPDCLYIKTDKGTNKIEEGLYATLYERNGCHDGNTENHWYHDGSRVFCEALLRYIEDNDLELCGDIHMECPLDDISTNDPKDYLLKTFARVRKR
jgi:Predicted transcriptional regulators